MKRSRHKKSTDGRYRDWSLSSPAAALIRIVTESALITVHVVILYFFRKDSLGHLVRNTSDYCQAYVEPSAKNEYDFIFTVACSLLNTPYYVH